MAARRIYFLTVSLCLAITRAGAQELPTECRFPSAVDVLTAKRPGEVITSSDINQMRCILNAVQQHLLSGTSGRSSCSPVHVGGGMQSQMEFMLPEAASLSLPVFVSAIDSQNPGALEASVSASIGSTIARVRVWNHDPVGSRSGYVCIHMPR